MEIINATEKDRDAWNKFLVDNYPPIGAFMQTWEWGLFKEAWGKTIGRHFIVHNSERVAAFTLVKHTLPMGFHYGYVPRGPVIVRKYLDKQNTEDILQTIRTWATKSYPQFLFIRLEPPVSSLAVDLKSLGFYTPNYYIQPRYNHAINLDATEDKILATFHPSTKANIKKSIKRGVTTLFASHYNFGHQQFQSLAQHTINRNDGYNVYPKQAYFDAMFKVLPPCENEHAINNQLTLATFFGYCNKELAAIHYVVFFGNTATYLYGASSTAHLSSKVTTALHWFAMQEAKRLGMTLYDLGAVDEKIWPSLTTFKRQFRGQEFSYVGNIDIPLRPFLYKIYNIIQKIRRLA